MWNRIFLFFLLLCACSLGCADLCPSPWRKGEPLKEKSLNPGISQAVDLNIDGPWNLFASANFLLWVPKEHGLELSCEQAFDPEIFPSTINPISYDYKPAFSVSLAFQSERDNWSFAVDYLRFYFSEHGHADYHFGLSTLQPIWLAQKEQMARARSHWKLKLDAFDALCGRSFYFGERVTLFPKWGIKTLFLHQKYTILYTTAFDYYDIRSTNISRSWAIGPNLACNTSFLLGHGLTLQTNLAASLVFQKFHAQSRESDYSDLTSTKYYLKNRFSQIAPLLETSIGLSWKTLFSRDHRYFEVYGGYDWLYFSSQNALRKLHDTLSRRTVGDFGELMLHGLTVSLIFAF